MLSNFPFLMDAYIYLICALKGCGRVESSLIVAQARFETNDYKSDLCTKYKNLFGMGVATIRDRSQAGAVTLGSGTFSVYRSYYQSVVDRLLWNSQFSDYVNVYNDLLANGDENAGAVRFVAWLYSNKYFTGNQPQYLAGVVTKLLIVKSTIGKGMLVLVGVGLFVVVGLFYIFVKLRKKRHAVKSY